MKIFPSAKIITRVLPNVFFNHLIHCSSARSTCFVVRNQTSYISMRLFLRPSISHDKTSTSSARAMKQMIKKTFGITHVMILCSGRFSQPRNTTNIVRRAFTGAGCITFIERNDTAFKKTVYSSCPRSPWRSKCYFRRAKTAGRECRSNHSICSVWKLPSAETITCVVPNVFVTLEVLVLSSECDLIGFGSHLEEATPGVRRR